MESNPSPPPQNPNRNWAELPGDVIALILSKIGAIEMLVSAQFVCSSWCNVCKDPATWRSINVLPDGDYYNTRTYNLEALCKNAVDRSCGGLVSLRIEYIATDSLINYVSHRAKNLKQLRIVSSYSLGDEALAEAASRFPLLEELELSYCSLSKEALKGVAVSCPLLISLKLNCQGYKCPHVEDNDEALAIANHMPNLRYLQIFGNRLTNHGVQAILNGCPHLEFLDLRQCFNVNLKGKLGRRCAEQIRDVRSPNDPTDDYPYNPELPEYVLSDEDDPYGFSDIEMVTDDADDCYAFSDG
ncbi:putative F-box/LRR-repeat protein 23 [Mercurialis annua]|uniref:putative F-box/LRR-repeat protein 23 n=1 Tax=Mercurialis annua TaxID=3986 RepID=UPI00215EA82C|nr:putative F-box/LRR-repeat protein 23 [Mercurialis annua]